MSPILIGCCGKGVRGGEDRKSNAIFIMLATGDSGLVSLLPEISTIPSLSA